MAVEASSRKVRRLCDPFGGSGTSALAAQFMGIESITIEVNPFLAQLIEAKVATYDVHALLAALPRVARRVARCKGQVADVFAGLPPTFLEPGHNGRWLFDAAVADQLAKLRRCIAGESSASVRQLFTVLMGGLLIEFSNAVVSGKGRRYRRGWEFRRADPEAVLPRFCEATGAAINEIDALRQRPRVLAEVVLGDSRARIRDVGPVDLIVCSPPYPNSFDYTDVYNVELWMLGFLGSSQDNQRLRRSTLSSHVQIDREFSRAPSTPTLKRVISKLERVRAQLWDKRLVEMVGGYFADLSLLLDGSADALKPRGQAWFVVGDSQYAGTRIPVAAILSELALSRGFRLLRREPFRSMRLSPQQGGSQRLVENLLVFAKA